MHRLTSAVLTDIGLSTSQVTFTYGRNMFICCVTSISRGRRGRGGGLESILADAG